jgi:hypothetical protein
LPDGESLLLKKGSMARTHRIQKNAVTGVRLLGGLFVILVLACGTPNGTGSPRAEQNSADSGTGQDGRKGISQAESQQQPYIADEVLVKFKSGTDAQTIERIQSALKLETVRKFSSPNLFLMKINDGSSVPSVIERLKSYEAVKYAEPNYVVKTGQQN